LFASGMNAAGRQQVPLRLAPVRNDKSSVGEQTTAPALLLSLRVTHRFMSLAIMYRMPDIRMDDFDDDEEIPVISGRGEGIMEEAPATGSGSTRRNEDIALDLMKFVAMTTGYGRTTSSGVGFTGTGSAAKPEDYAEKLLELYSRCLGTVSGKK
jgi:hypothetical protein